MNYQAAANKIDDLKIKIRYLSMILGALLIANIMLIGVVGFILKREQRTIVPALIQKTFTVSDTRIDNSYLEQMGLMFLELRLNLTPDTVAENHRILIRYADPEFYAQFLKILGEEEKVIEKQKISSVFYPDEVIPDVAKLTLEVKGTLKRWVGDMELSPERKVYLIKCSYKSGVLKVHSFSELKAEG